MRVMACCLILFSFVYAIDHSDPYFTKVYDSLHDSPTQQKFQKIAPIPVASVYIQRPGEGEAEMREHFRTMRELGYTALKQIMNCPGWTREQIGLIALDEGIIPWWYGQGGWEEITDDLLNRLGIDSRDMQEIRNDPRMLEYQHNVLKRRLQKAIEWHQQGRSTRFRGRVPEVGGVGPGLTEEGKILFVQWVKDQYGTIDSLNFAYNQHHFGLAPREGEPFQSWQDFEERWQQLNNKEYRHLRDIFRFKADNRETLIKTRIQEHMEFDPEQPFRAGGEMGMFLPFSYRGVDMEGIAELMTEVGSFYPSIHLAWHFDEVNHEITRPIYMQAALTHDYFKGGWSATWESTGGPQQFSGGKGGNTFMVDKGTMTQLMLSFLAAGYKGFGMWSWSSRSAGWEAGEYSLLDRHNKVTPRAIRVGKIGQTAQRYRDELWQSRKEPLVGVYQNWDNEAIWAAMSLQGREHLRQDPIDARVGVSRALINANIPYEYVTDRDLRKGLAQRYRIIYLPFVISVPSDIMPILADYVEQGGRLVMDMPSAYYDEFGALFSTDQGTFFEKTFGTIINEYQGAGVNRPVKLDNLDLQGFIVDLDPTHSHVLAAYDNGLPAITEAFVGEGSAVLLGYEASKHCFKPRSAKAEEMLLRYTLGTNRPRFTCQGAIVYRLAAPEADHYFIINDGPQRPVQLNVDGFNYKSAIDAVTAQEWSMKEMLVVPAYDGRWIRCEK